MNRFHTNTIEDRTDHKNFRLKFVWVNDFDIYTEDSCMFIQLVRRSFCQTVAEYKRSKEKM